MAISLRSYHAEDFDALYEIDQVCYDSEVAYDKGELRAYLRYPGADCVVAESDGNGVAGGGSQIAGFCIAAHEDEKGYIVTIDVLEKFRRDGIGSKLIKEVERRLEAAGVRVIALETATDSESAVAFWQKHGYRTRGVRKGYYPNGRDAFAMTKTLKEKEPAPQNRKAAKSR